MGKHESFTESKNDLPDSEVTKKLGIYHFDNIIHVTVIVGKDNEIILNLTKAIEKILGEYNKALGELELSELTQTEKELYELKKQGYSILEIAAKTNKSEGTVRNQLCKAYKKLKKK